MLKKNLMHRDEKVNLNMYQKCK